MSVRAWQALGLDTTKGRLDVGYDADLVLLDEELNVCSTYVGGELAWERDGVLSGGDA